MSEEAETKEHEKCQRVISKLLDTVPKIRTLVEAIQKKRRLSADVNATNLQDAGVSGTAIVCTPCDIVAGGFYDTDKKIISICENRLGNSRAALERTLTHELVHAFDDAEGLRGKTPPLDWSDCQQRACTEVRAAALSGDCTFLAEVSRGNFSIFGYYRSCVQRRAKLSLAMQKECADKAVCSTNAVFEECFANSQPFETK